MASDERNDALTITIDGALDRKSVPARHADLAVKVRTSSAQTINLDLSGVTSMDSSGAALCHVLVESAKRRGAKLVLTGASTQATDALSVFRVRLTDETVVKRHIGWPSAVGDAALRSWDELIHLLTLLTDTLHFTFLGIFTKRHRINGHTVVEQMVRIGLESLGIVGLISLLVGLTVALQSAAQLRQFGANIYIADLVGIAMTREMGPLMTAILLAGRSGSSVAAEISTMVITEEVDALKTMGINPVRFLVVPRFLAISFTQPLLTVMADALGIFGGFIIGITYLQLAPGIFIDELISSLAIKDIFTGLIKSVSFAWIIVFVGAHRGFRVHGGAEGVGIATTMSVVQAIFLVIAADAFFSLVFYFGG